MLYLDDELTFVKKMKDLVQQSLVKPVILTKFLSLREQVIVEDLFRHSPVQLNFYGGYPASERKRCLILHEDIPYSEDMFQIACYEIKYHPKYLQVTHANILGTLMSLKIDRQMFGDIILNQQKAYFFTTKEIVPIILQEFNMINHQPIQVELYTEPIHYETPYETKEIIVSSLRVDNLISVVYRLSRSEAVELIERAQVYLNFQLVKEKSILCKENDIVSVRRHGRFIVGPTLRTTKSGKYLLEVKEPI